MAASIRPGDVITYPFGMRRELDTVVVLDVHTHDSGDLSIRYRFLSNPRGIAWKGFIARDEQDVRVISRGVARVDGIRPLIPA